MRHHIPAFSIHAIFIALSLGLSACAQADSIVFSDQFGSTGSVASGWVSQGSATVTGGSTSVQLTSQNTNSSANPPAGATNQEGNFFQAGSLFYTGSTFNSGNWELTAEIQLGTGNYFGNAVHADGLTFTWLAEPTSPTELLGGAGGLLGVPTGADVKGYSFEFDSNDNGEYHDPSINPPAGQHYEYTGLESLSGTALPTHVTGSIATPGGSSVFSDAQVGPDFLATSKGGWLPVSLTCTTTNINAQGVGQADFVLAWGGIVSGSAGAGDFDSLTSEYEFQVNNYSVSQDAYFGFTAATGLYTENHDIRDVTLTQLGGVASLDRFSQGGANGPAGGGSTPELPTWLLMLPALSLRVCRRGWRLRQRHTPDSVSAQLSRTDQKHGR